MTSVIPLLNFLSAGQRLFLATPLLLETFILGFSQPVGASHVSGHFPTFFRATTTGLSTTTTMLVLMLLAFCRARGTDGSAHAAKFGHKTGVTTGEGSAIPTDIRAIDAKLRPFRHLAETLIATRFPLYSTSHTGFYAGLMLMSHGRPSFLLIDTI